VDLNGRTHAIAVSTSTAPGPRLTYQARSVPGAPEQPLRTLGGGEPSRPRAVLDECGTVVAVWDERRDGSHSVVMARLTVDRDGGVRQSDLQAIATTRSSPQPVVAAALGGVVVAWIDRDADGPRVAFRRVGLASICSLGTAR
jgi:hypothetical protein